MIENVGSLGHLDHEGRASAGQIVGCSDARENLVEGADFRAARGHERAAMREQGDERDLAHIRRFAAHVGTRHEQHLPRGPNAGIVRDEMVDLRFDHCVTACFDFDHGLCGELRLGEVERVRAFGEGREQIDFGERPCNPLQRRNVRREQVEKPVVEQLFARERAFLC
jgi:hypothetical protein